MNYIEREAAIRAIENDCLEAVYYTKRDAIDCIVAQPLADVVENKEGQVLVPFTEEELRHLVNDTIAYIWSMEKTKRDKEEFGYFSRKELLKKLEYFLKSFEKPVCCCDKRRENDG